MLGMVAFGAIVSAGPAQVFRSGRSASMASDSAGPAPQSRGLSHKSDSVGRVPHWTGAASADPALIPAILSTAVNPVPSAVQSMIDDARRDPEAFWDRAAREV